MRVFSPTSPKPYFGLPDAIIKFVEAVYLHFRLRDIVNNQAKVYNKKCAKVGGGGRGRAGIHHHNQKITYPSMNTSVQVKFTKNKKRINSMCRKTERLSDLQIIQSG